MQPNEARIRIRDYPYPFRALLAICSDLDNTVDWRTYAEIARYLNTHDTTAMGQGVGLEVGNSVYFDMAPDEFAYWNTDDAGREMVRRLIRSGHIDVLHSFGDLATTRAHAERALEELARHDCVLPVWVDHRVAPTNVGADIMQGVGDVTDSACYHTDLTYAHGIRFVWRGRVTSVVGQNVPHNVGGVWQARRPLASARTVAKEFAKHRLARRGNAQYAMHADNAVMRPCTLRDGTRCYEFLRSNPHWAGVEQGDTARGLAETLSDVLLDRVEQRRGATILYTHLGKGADPRQPVDAFTCSRFAALADRHQARRILVTTTARLLRYLAIRDNLRFRTSTTNGRTVITVERVEDPVLGTFEPTTQDLAGVTFVADGDRQLEIRDLHDRAIEADSLQDGGKTLATIPWVPLTFPALGDC